jgi:hypothetical protein
MFFIPNKRFGLFLVMVFLAFPTAIVAGILISLLPISNDGKGFAALAFGVIWGCIILGALLWSASRGYEWEEWKGT